MIDVNKVIVALQETRPEGILYPRGQDKSGCCAKCAKCTQWYDDVQTIARVLGLHIDKFTLDCIE